MPLRVLSFNMQFGQVWNSDNPDTAPIDLQQTIAELRRLSADIIFLQEVEQVDVERGQITPPPNYEKLKAALPGYHSFFSYPSHDSRELPFGYGLAIFAKMPLYETEVFNLPAPVLNFQFLGRTTSPTNRVLIGAKTKVAGRAIQLFNTHLQSFFIIEKSSDAYPEQRGLVAAKLRNSLSLPTLLGGDFNTAPGEGTVSELEAAGYRSVQAQQKTWKRMPYVLDHLFYNALFQLTDWQVIETSASDHHILSATFELSP